MTPTPYRVHQVHVREPVLFQHKCPYLEYEMTPYTVSFFYYTVQMCRFLKCNSFELRVIFTKSRHYSHFNK